MSLTTFSGPVQSLNGFIVAPPNTLDGSVKILAANNSAGVVTTITNATQALSHTYTIPDAGADAFFALSSTSSGVHADFQKFIGLNSVVLFGTGTWTITRIAEANYVARHTAADDTSILGIDITEAIRTTALRGFSLASIDVIYSIGTLALDAHSATLDKISFIDGAAATITSAPITGTLTTATAANVKVVNLVVTTPAFNNLADSKYVFELTVNAAATSTYDFYGLVLKFSRNDS